MSNFYVDQPLEKDMDKSSDTLYMQIVSRIRKLMSDGHLKEGDLLPSERELAQMFDVSRVPVREALKVLEFLGAVQHVRGKGVFVKKISMRSMLNNIDFIMMDSLHMLKDLFEAREAFEVQAVQLAAQRRTDGDIDQMERALAEMEGLSALDKDVSEASVKFHTAIVNAAHNEVIGRINEFLSDMLTYSRRQTLSNRGRHGTSLDYHKRILEKIRTRDSEGAMRLMREHLSCAKAVIAAMSSDDNHK